MRNLLQKIKTCAGVGCAGLGVRRKKLRWGELRIYYIFKRINWVREKSRDRILNYFPCYLSQLEW